MKNLNQKLEYLKWLRLIGVEYYFSEKKDSDISWLYDLQSCHPREGVDPGPSPVITSKALASSGDPENIITGSPRPLTAARHDGGLDDNALNTRHNGTGRVTTVTLPLHHNEKALDSRDSSTSRKLADSAGSLEELKDIVKNFNGCDLKGFAANTVFSDGNPLAEIMLVGEAPGAKEDELGIPFCGESGILLDTMLLTIGLSRKENIYITNTVFWRPPANRKPTNQEMEICRPFLEKHIALVNPKLIICVGSTAVADLLGDKITISLARNNTYAYQNKYLSKPINTMSIFHPAYLLRQSEKKKDMWFDLIKIQQFIKKNL